MSQLEKLVSEWCEAYRATTDVVLLKASGEDFLAPFARLKEAANNLYEYASKDRVEK